MPTAAKDAVGTNMVVVGVVVVAIVVAIGDGVVKTNEVARGNDAARRQQEEVEDNGSDEVGEDMGEGVCGLRNDFMDLFTK